MRKRIVCPKCGNHDVDFVSGNKRGLNIFLLLAVALIGVAIIIALFVNGHLVGAIIALVLFSLTLSILKIIQRNRREELHTKAICRECGHKWFID